MRLSCLVLAAEKPSKKRQNSKKQKGGNGSRGGGGGAGGSAGRQNGEGSKKQSGAGNKKVVEVGCFMGVDVCDYVGKGPNEGTAVCMVGRHFAAQHKKCVPERDWDTEATKKITFKVDGVEVGQQEWLDHYNALRVKKNESQRVRDAAKSANKGKKSGKKAGKKAGSKKAGRKTGKKSVGK